MVENKHRLSLNKLKYLYFVLIALLIFSLTYGKILNGFFQQDEWFTFGSYTTYQNSSLLSILKYLFAFNVGHYNPLTNMVQFILFRIWGINYVKFALFGIVLEIGNIFCIFILAKRIFKKDILFAYLATLLFLSFAASSQAVSWVLVNTATLSSSFFGIVSVIFFYDYIAKKKKLFLIYSLFILLVSLLFKEITIGLFPLYFIILLFISLKDILYVMIPGLFYFIFRVLMFFTPNPASEKIVTQTLPIKYLILDFITLPFKSLSQVLIPQDAIIYIARFIALFFPKYAGSPGTTKFDLFALNQVLGPLSVAIALVFVTLALILFFRGKITNLKIIYCLSLLWVFLNSLIFALSPETTGVTVLVDSRNLYFISIGVAFFMTCVLKSLNIKNNKKAIILVSLFILNIFFLNQDLTQVTNLGAVRKRILNKIYNDHPKLAGKQVFYFESNSSYFGLPTEVKIPPFQSGFGQTLLVWYSRNQILPIDFYKNHFLWPIDSEGYKEVNGVGFGYYRNFTDLAQFLAKNKSNEPNIIAYRFNFQDNTLIDIRSDLTQKIDGYLAPKSLINSSGFSINSVIDMKKNFDLAQISLGSYNYQNQIMSILLSTDGKKWTTIYSGEAIAGSFYFEPTIARFIKIDREGKSEQMATFLSGLKLYAKN